MSDWTLGLVSQVGFRKDFLVLFVNLELELGHDRVGLPPRLGGTPDDMMSLSGSLASLLSGEWNSPFPSSPSSAIRNRASEPSTAYIYWAS